MGIEQLLLQAALAIFAASQTKKSWQAIPATAAPFIDLLARAEKAAGIPPTLLARLAYQESKFDPNASNPSGAKGLMQLVPAFHAGIDPLNPEQAIPYAANYLATLKKGLGTWEKALAAYNWGIGNVKLAVKKYGENGWRAHLPPETYNYLLQIGNDVDIS